VLSERYRSVTTGGRGGDRLSAGALT
jgi:hypothetical protein